MNKIGMGMLAGLAAALMAFAPAQRIPSSTLRVARQTNDSVWVTVACTARNADTVRVAWTYPSRTRTVAVSPAACRDTLAVARGTVAQTASVGLTPKRGALTGSTVTRSIAIPARVVPVTPPTIDSVVVDTTKPPVPDTTAPPTAGSWDLASQLPAGLTKRADTQHEALVPSGWPGYATRMGAQPSLLTNAGAPLNDATAMRQTWTGVIDGESPHYLWWPTQSTHLYVATIVRISSAMMPPNEVKWITFNPGNGFAWIGFYREGNAHEMRFVRRGSRDYYAGRVGAVRPLPTDQWAKVQLEVRINPTRVRLWINDVLTMSESGVLPSTFPVFSWDGMTAFGELQLGSTWGGGNGVTAPANAFIDYARTAIWTN